jgi:2-polyprenyl-3-methyl-5-hydroxy-6-metoxy-1,4-benzoquinol methylase
MYRILLALLRRYAHAINPHRVLDAGCGTGYLSSVLEREESLPMYAIDLGREGVRYARGMGVERVARADIRQLPFRPGSFDMVLSMDVIVHLDQVQDATAVAEMTRVLASGGLLVVRASALTILRSRHSVFVNEQQRFTRARLLRIIRAAGLEVLRSTYVNSLLLPAAVAKFRIWEPLTRQAPSTGVTMPTPLLNRLLYAPLALEAKAVAAGLNFPLGQTVIVVARKR